MATILLGAIGAAIGGSIGGSVLGIGAAVIGKAVGAAIGRAVDQSLIAMLTPDQQNFGPEVGQVGLALPREGEMLARGVGWQKLPARICWPENLHFAEESETVSTGGKGAQNKSITTTYYAEVTIAVALRDGETDMIGRVWADGSLITLADVCDSVTIYKGTPTQEPDPTLEAVEGAGNVPDWRGVTYVVLEGMNLSSFGNRIPQLEFETFTAARGAPAAFVGVSLSPTAGEFGLDPNVVTERLVENVQEAGGTEEVVIDESPVNNNVASDAADVKTSIDLLAVQHPQVTHVVIEYPWFGNSLRCGDCLIQPRVEMAARGTAPDLWVVQGISRGSATVVSQVSGAGAFAGTPSDAGVIRLIEDLKARGFEVTLAPRVLMDIAPGNGLVDPYGGIEQAAYPDRGRITCNPAPGQPATVDKTAAAATQVDGFFGGVGASDFSIIGGVISYSGPAGDWGVRRFVFHAAHLAIAAGGVNDFLISDGLAGVTRVRSAAVTYPATAHLQALAADLRAAFDVDRSGYWAAGWTDPVIYSVANPGNGVVLNEAGRGSLPISDEWRWDEASATASSATSWGSLEKSGYTYSGGLDGYLLNKTDGISPGYIFVDFPIPQSEFVEINVSFQHGRFPGITATNRRWELQEFDSTIGIIGSKYVKNDNYSSVTATPGWQDDIKDGIVFRSTGDFIRFENWFTANDRVLRDLRVSIQLKRHVRLAYAADWLEFGAHDARDGTGDVLFPLDELWADENIDCIAINYQPPLSDIRDGGAESVYDLSLLKANIEAGEYFDWEYLSEADRRAKTRTNIVDAVENEPWIFRPKDIFNWWNSPHHPRPGGVRDAGPSAWVAKSKQVRLFFKCPAVDRASNQPSVEGNPNASEYALPHFSNGARDDEAQGAYIRAIAEFWTADSRGVVDSARCAAMGWDARPWPVFPHTDIWPDAAAWPISSSLAGRRVVDLAAWLADELDYRGLDYEIDQIVAAIDGVTVTNLAGFMAVAGPLLNLFNLDATEVAGKIKISSRALQVLGAAIDLEAVIPLSETDRFRAPRGNPGQLPAQTYLSHRDIGHEYDTNTVTSRLNRPGKGESRVDVPVLIDPQRARDLLRVKHLDAAVELDGLECELPPSWLDRLVPGTVVSADTGLGIQEWLILNRNIGAGIRIEARRFDRDVLRPNPTSRVGYPAPGSTSYGSTALAMPDLPWINSSDPAHDLRAAIWVDPAQGNALMRSLSEATGYTVAGQFATRSTMGVLTSSLLAGSVYGWDRGNTVAVRLFSGSPISRAEIDVRAGQNWMAVRTDAAANKWELMAFRDASLTGTKSFDLTHLLRGLRGSQIAASVSAGALVVFLQDLPFAGVEVDNIGTPYWWSAGPSVKSRTDASWITRQVTPAGVGLMPFAPAKLAGVVNGGGDLVLSWVRQDRDPRADQLDRVGIPMSEDTLSYGVTIGGSVWDVAAEGLTVLAADLPAAPFNITVQQQSGDVGLGHPATITME